MSGKMAILEAEKPSPGFDCQEVIKMSVRPQPRPGVMQSDAYVPGAGAGSSAHASR